MKFTEITFLYGCFPVNLLDIFRTCFYKNTFEGLLLDSKTCTLLSTLHSIQGSLLNKSKSVLKETFLFPERFVGLLLQSYIYVIIVVFRAISSIVFKFSFLALFDVLFVFGNY